LDVLAGRQLLAEPADHEQGVVDAEPEAERGGQLDREDRHVGDRAEDEQFRDVPMMATPPMISGNTAETTLPNTKINRIIVSGTAMPSARARLVPTCLLTSTVVAAWPPGRRPAR
jgi:hypothetical protein